MLMLPKFIQAIQAAPMDPRADMPYPGEEYSSSWTEIFIGLVIIIGIILMFALSCRNKPR